MKRKRTELALLKVGLYLLNASLILIMIAILRVFLTKLFYMIKFLSE